MAEYWRQRSSNQVEPEEDEDELQNTQVRTVSAETSQLRRRSGSSRKSRSPAHDHHRHKHKHKHHHKKDSKCERRHRRSRSRSRSRSTERSRDCESRHYRPNRDHRERRFSPGRMQKERSRNVPESLMCRHRKPETSQSPNSSDDDDDVIPPFSSKSIPPAAAKLKAEIEKRKQMWNKKEKPTENVPSTSVWKQTAFSGDNDGRVSAKFKRLMGIKDAESESSSAGVEKPGNDKRQEYFENLEKQYEVARATTHTQRGLGLGFSSSSRLLPR